jgi:hypothetical protein
MFDANGRFSLIIMRGDLPKYASNKRVDGTPDEYKATVTGSLAYFGTYTKVCGPLFDRNPSAKSIACHARIRRPRRR